ncbi:TlpA disulfide reductase family protein [Flavicella sp.]|uniref:TlpA family protein disulfide reductase n=1 Tax=Flavicella sp. TaxID=2957742 RepID=UPI0030165C9E
MNKILLVLTAIVFLSCSNEKNNFLTVSGTVINNTETILTIENETYNKKITIDSKGHFKDTLHLKNVKDLASYEENFYGISIGQNGTFSFIQNGFDIELTIDGDDFKFKGDGAQNTNYIKEKIEIGSEFMNIPEYFNLEKDAFDEKLGKAKSTFDALLKKYPDLDSAFAKAELKSNEELYTTLTENYTEQHNLLKSTSTSKGSPSPKFSGYENYKGGKNSLEDFRGKYVYIDVWATWCGPCIQQIPFLQTLEENYHDKNIEFVSISIDKQNLKNTWKQMISDKKMTGVQLFADGDQSFSRAYKISGIPRFILIDPQGNIVEANAPRPSDPRLTAMFADLGL